MTWTLRRILGVIFALSSLAVVVTLFWVTETYQQFAIRNQEETIAKVMTDLVDRHVEAHRRDLVVFVDEWSRLSTFVDAVADGDGNKAQLAADRIMLAREVTEGTINLQNVVVFSKDFEFLASTRRGTQETIGTQAHLLDRLRKRDLKSQRQTTFLLWRAEGERSLHSAIAPVGGLRGVGFVEFVTDPAADMTGVGDSLPGHFQLTAIDGRILFEATGNGTATVGDGPAMLDTLTVPISSSVGDTWAVAELIRDISTFNTAVDQQRNRALGIIALGLLASILIGWLLLRIAVFRRLREFADAMKSLADGRTNIAIPAVGPDEFAVMKTSLDSLRDAVRDREKAKRFAEEANRAKSAFLSNMSHELRTPLSAIIGFTEVVISNDKEPLTEEQLSSLSQVLEAGRHLLALINDVLDLSKIEAGVVSLSVEPVDAGQVTDECLSLIQSFASSKNVMVHSSLKTESLPFVLADRVRLKQILLNLISNAIKYNRDPGNVYLERGTAKNGVLRIGVRDQGPGISEEQMADLFVPFERLGAENSSVEGTGIGLAITKNLVEQMDGSISVESVVGEGSVFWLNLPISKDAPQFSAEPDWVESDFVAEGLILYIEDNPANLEIVRKIVSRQPALEIIGASSGELGLEQAHARAPDVILLDINLTGMDGFEVIAELKSSEKTQHIPVIAVTAAATETDRKRGEAAGFASYLTKPIPARELLRAVQQALEPALSQKSDLPAAPRESKVLVVDDSPRNLSVASKQLTTLGVAFEATDDPVKALENLKVGGFSLALVDIGMPVMNGIQLTKRLRDWERSRGSYTPVVAFTAHLESKDDFARYRAAGIDGHLAKPAELKEMASVLDRWLTDKGPRPQDSDAPRARQTSERRPPVIDQARIRDILGIDDEETIREIFDEFIAAAPHEVEKLSNALAARDPVRTTEIAHRFKSEAANVAAGRLADALQRIEREGNNGDWRALQGDLEIVRQECEAAIRAMRKMA